MISRRNFFRSGAAAVIAAPVITLAEIPKAKALVPATHIWSIPYPINGHSWDMAHHMTRTIGQLTATRATLEKTSGNMRIMKFRKAADTRPSVLGWTAARIDQLVRQLGIDWASEVYFSERPIDGTFSESFSREVWDESFCAHVSWDNNNQGRIV